MNMTRAEYEKSQLLRSELMPPAPVRKDMASAFEVVSFNMSAGDGLFALRFADAKGEIKDFALDQAVASELVGYLAKSLHALGWIDSAGKALLDPPPRSEG